MNGIIVLIGVSGLAIAGISLLGSAILWLIGSATVKWKIQLKRVVFKITAASVFFVFLLTIGIAIYSVYRNTNLLILVQKWNELLPEDFWYNRQISVLQSGGVGLTFVGIYFFLLRPLVSRVKKRFSWSRPFLRLFLKRVGLVLLLYWAALSCEYFRLSYEILALANTIAKAAVIFNLLALGQDLVYGLRHLVKELSKSSQDFHLIPLLKELFPVLQQVAIATKCIVTVAYFFKELRLPQADAIANAFMQLALAFVLSKTLTIAVNWWVKKKTAQLEYVEDPAEVRRQITLISVAQKGVKYLVWLAASAFGLAALGFNTWPVLIGSGIIATSVLNSAGRVINDVLSGLLILSENYYSIGDRIQIFIALEGASLAIIGEVKAISFRSTIVEENSGELTTIWNSSVIMIRSSSNYPVYSKNKKKKGLLIIDSSAIEPGSEESKRST